MFHGGAPPSQPTNTAGQDPESMPATDINATGPAPKQTAWQQASPFDKLNAVAQSLGKGLQTGGGQGQGQTPMQPVNFQVAQQPYIPPPQMQGAGMPPSFFGG
jgi:hypothetical protein